MENKTLTKNIFSLVLVQFSNYIAPLLVLPYLSRVLGLDGFGIVAMAMSLCAIALIFTDYGFNLSAPYWLAKNKKNKEEVACYLGAVFVVKLSIFLIVAVVVLVFMNVTKIMPKQFVLQLGILISILFATLQPSWFFLGIEKMKNVTIFMVTAKLSYVLLVFLFVKEASHVSLVLVCFALSNFLASAIGILYIYKENYWIAVPKIPLVFAVLKDGVIFFISRLAVGIYTSASTFIIGAFTGVNSAALYSSAEKLYQAGQSAMSPVSQALFPYLTRTGDRKVLFKLVGLLFIPLCVGVAFCIYHSAFIVTTIFGQDFVAATKLLQIFLITLLVTFISVNFGYPAFASIGRVDIANKSVIMAAAIQIISIITLYIIDGITAVNICLSVLFVEVVVMIIRVGIFLFFCKNMKPQM